MTDAECIGLLQWCLPRLRMRWAGFRRVRRQVCRRVERRLTSLDLPDAAAYRDYLGSHPEEWSALDAFCRISISRFYRDGAVWACLERDVLPRLARRARAGGDGIVRAWSIGCASGEEPYTLAILWAVRVAPRCPSIRLTIVATDADGGALARAARALYAAGSMKDLPQGLRSAAFARTAEGFTVTAAYRKAVTFREEDVRRAAPQARFDLILCRNLAFTYFEDTLQAEVLGTIRDRLLPGGVLVVGRRERLPQGSAGFAPWGRDPSIYRRVPEEPVETRGRARPARAGHSPKAKGPNDDAGRALTPPR